MSYQCLDITDSLPSAVSLKGVIVYNDDNNLSAFLSNEETKDTSFFPREEGDRLLSFEVSPDGKYVSYIHYSVRTEEDRLIIATAEGQPIWSKVIYDYAWEWFDSERLIHLDVPQNGTPSLFLLNPFTGQRQELRFDYPDSRLFTNDPSDRWGFGRGGLPVYDPTLTRVLYPECDSQCQDKVIRREGGWPIVLWDLETNQPIARLMTVDSYGTTPVWTPDGKQFVLATTVDPDEWWVPASEFFTMSREGQLRQLTHFRDYSKEVHIPDSYSLSPDGKLLAFWIAIEPNLYEDLRLAVLNIETGEVVNHCIKGDAFADNATEPYSPVWSPDSTQLLVISRIPEDTKVRRVVAVDILHNYAARVNADMEPVGWMVVP
jgi:Tol biopolymer transport system component